MTAKNGAEGIKSTAGLGRVLSLDSLETSWSKLILVVLQVERSSH